VAGLDHMDRHVRSPQAVAQPCAPLRVVPRQRHGAPKPVGKQRWASLATSMHTVSATGCAEGKRRDPTHRAAWVVVVDGDLTPLDESEQTARACGVDVVIIVDIMHVLAYLWKAAKAWLPRDDPRVSQWVGAKILPLRQGQAKAIIRNVHRGARAKGMSAKQREPIDQCATYLANHAAYRNSPHSLIKGYPLATGGIEGACRHLGKERLEITGARWGLEGGEAVRKRRALVITGDCDAYWDFHEQQEYPRNHRAKCSEMPTARSRLQLMSRGKD
jgi:hypothetical protein